MFWCFPHAHAHTCACACACACTCVVFWQFLELLQLLAISTTFWSGKHCFWCILHFAFLWQRTEHGVQCVIWIFWQLSTSFAKYMTPPKRQCAQLFCNVLQFISCFVPGSVDETVAVWMRPGRAAHESSCGPRGGTSLATGPWITYLLANQATRRGNRILGLQFRG